MPTRLEDMQQRLEALRTGEPGAESGTRFDQMGAALEALRNQAAALPAQPPSNPPQPPQPQKNLLPGGIAERVLAQQPPPEQPGFVERRIVQPAERVGEAAVQGFTEGFGSSPVGHLTVGVPAEPVLGAINRTFNLLSTVGEAGLRGAYAFYTGAVDATTQFLTEAGVNPFNAARLGRDLKAAPEAFAGFGDPMASLGKTSELSQTARAVRRPLTKADQVERRYQEIKAEMEQEARNRQLNLAKQDARRAGQAEAEAAGAPQIGGLSADISEGQVVVAYRKATDAATEATAVPYLRQPDQILTDVPLFTEELMRPERMKQAVDFARDILRRRGGVDPTGLSNDRVFKDVMGLLSSEDFSTSGFMADLAAAGLKEQDFIQMLGYSASQYGRGLQTLSTFYKGMREKALRGDPTASDFVNAATEEARARAAAPPGRPGLNAYEISEPWRMQATRIWRKLLVSLPATHTRNFIDSGLFRQVLNVGTRTLDATMQRMFAPRGTIKPAEPFEEMRWMFGPQALLRSKVSPTGIVTRGRSDAEMQLDRVLAAFPETRHDLFMAIEVDLTRERALRPDARFMDKVEAGIDSSVLATNRLQEEVVRKAVFGVSLDRRLRAVGSSLEDMVDSGHIPAGTTEALRGALEDSLFTTFALPARMKDGPLAKTFYHYARIIDSLAPVGPLVEPFANFLYNAIKMTVEYSPTMGLRTLTVENRAKIMAGNYEPLAREIIGTATFFTAMALRQGEIPGVKPGPRWDEVETSDGKVISLAPFATISPFLYLADLTMRVDEGRIQPSVDLYRELRQGLMGGTSQVNIMTDSMQEAMKTLLDVKSPSDLEGLTDYGSQVLGGAFRPLQVLRDLRAEYNTDVRVLRETRGQGLDAAIRNIVAPETLPVRESPVRGEPSKLPRFTLPGTVNPQTGKPLTLGAGVINEISGLSARQPRNPAERELVRLGFTSVQLSPKTGDKRLDALVARYQGPVFEEAGRIIVQSPRYMALGVKAKTEVMRNLILLSREPGLRAAQAAAPTAFAYERVKRLPGTQLQAITEMFNKLRPRGTPTFEEILDEVQRQAEREIKAQGLAP